MRLAALKSFPMLDIDEDARSLAEKILAGGGIPAEHPEDGRRQESSRRIGKAVMHGTIGVDIEPFDPSTWDGGKKTTFVMFPKEKSVSGIGEDAYTFMGGIIFRKGKAKVTIITSAYLGTKPKPDIAKYIAEQVAARL